MKSKYRLLIVPVAIALILSFFPGWQANAQTYDYELTSVTGIWTDTDGGDFTVNGIDTNLVSWGVPNPPGGQSGLRFDGSTGKEFNEGDYFLLGTLTHLNWPVGTPTAKGATLEITLDFAQPDISPDPSFTFEFEIEETPNAGKCPRWHTPGAIKCDDRITFPQSYGQEVFLIGDKQYTLKIVGFVNSFPDGTPVSEFITHEKENNTAFLVGVLSSVLVESPAISITKKTNDQDISSAPGPGLVVGENVTWQYVIQNTGNVDLTDVSVTDDRIGAITCPSTSIASGELMTCTAAGTVTAGQYHNTATVTAHHPNGTLTESDSSWYHGIEPSIDIEKYVFNDPAWEDADSSPGPYLDGFDITKPSFKFVVTNNGNVALENISLSDDVVADLYADESMTSECVETDPLAPGDNFTCFGKYAWRSGHHVNEATASGDYDGSTFEDKDKAYYFGVNLNIDVEKSVLVGTLWVDADAETGPTLPANVIPTFKFEVTNDSNVSLTGVTLTDDKISSLFSDEEMTESCAQGFTLDAGESYTCYGSSVWAKGQQKNTAKAEGDFGSSQVSDFDDCHYFGIMTEISVEKSVLDGSTWADADSAPGPYFLSGNNPLFRFVVENNGNVDLSNVILDDDTISELFSDQELINDCIPPDPFTSGSSFMCYGSLTWDTGQHSNTATVTGEYDGSTVQDEDDGHYFGATPAIDVEKSVMASTWEDADSAPGPVLWNDPTFQFIVTNTGNVTLTDISLQDSDIATLYVDQTFLGLCSNEMVLAPGESYDCYGKLDWAIGQHEDTATTNGKFDGQSYSDTDQAHYFGPDLDIDVEKYVSNGSSWVDADSGTGPILDNSSTPIFKFVVTNTGNMELKQVDLTDNLITELFSDQAMTESCVEPDPFGKGDSFTCFGSLAWATGQHENIASVHAYNGEGVSDTDPAHYFGASLGIDVEKEIWDGTAWQDADGTPGPVLPGSMNPLFRFTVKNTSNAALNIVQLSDNVISSLYADQGLSAECAAPDPLASGASFICYGGLTWTAGQHANTATASGELEGLETSDIDQAHYFGGSSAISLDKSANPEIFTAVGNIIIYTFTVENTGDFALSGVTVTDPLPGLSQLDCNPTQPAVLNPGSSMTCTATYAITQDDLDLGTVENTAAAQGTDQYQNTVDDEDDAKVEGPKDGASIDLEKTPDPDIFLKVDDEITYTFVATNDGIFKLENVQISDPLPGLSSLDCSPTLPAVLDPGQSVTCTATYKITQIDINNGSVENTATATGVGSNEEEVRDQDSALIEGPKDEASIHLDKSAEPTTYIKAGEDIVYSFTVTNNGIYTLYDVTVADPLFSLDFGPIDELLPGESETFKYTYTITQGDVGAKTIENVATAMGYDPGENPVSDTDDETVFGPELPKVNPSPVLPTTGFAPGKITWLPPQSADKAYTEFSNFWLEIPRLGLSLDIVGVPQVDSGWDVSWLDREAGWLYGTTFPTWPGNSVVTGHVWDAFDQAGPFVNLNLLKYGDKIIIHLYGTEYTFEVRSKFTVAPDDLSLIEQEEDYAWLNLMTCKGFNAAADAYNYRLIVRAILVDVE